ncbi:MAG: hypothetical protein A2Z16_07510 [Chloroflexi bacterium RBG_16_54_18]|nr:MAG: hypothetical protein A2Z16_07510 [Chloroflexi bacterium RBG_16_54_18]
MRVSDTGLQISASAALQPPKTACSFNDFWEMSHPQRSDVLLKGITEVHFWHMLHNQAYCQAMTARGSGSEINPEEMALLLRPTAQTFKSYIDILDTPFPQDRPREFVAWLSQQISSDLPSQRLEQFRTSYPSLEALLKEIEKVYLDFDFEILTSSGTSGRASIIVRDLAGVNLTVESFYLSFQRYMGMRADHRAIFIMPRDTRIAMVRMASFSFRRVGLSEDRLHFTIPYPAHPDQVRIRAGRTYRSGWSGVLERRLWHPFMNWANDRLVTPRTVKQTIRLLSQAENSSDKVLLFGGWVHLHAIARALLVEGRVMHLPLGSLIGTGGGFKDLYPFTPEQIRADLEKSVKLENGQPAPMRDVYGMAEGNWAAMQCESGNYHIPPWIYAAVLDENDRFIEKPDGTGILAFYDPVGGGDLFPAFFKTADRVRLINGSRAYEPSLECHCGESGAYLSEGSIQRVDLIDEAGCAAQI